jgi:hypothetical protein
MATNINLKGVTELLITGITSPSISHGVVSFTIPGAAPGGSSGDIQYNNAGVFGGSAATVDASGNISALTVNATTGFQIAGAAPSGHFLVGNGTNYVDSTSLPSGTVLWNQIGNAAGNLTLANAGYTTTFNQTGAVAWIWANTTVGTVGSTNASPLLELAAQYWATGGVTGTDLWTVGIAALTAGLNSPSTLTFTHTGSTGVAAVRVPLLDIGGTDTGLSRLGAASIAVGNGTAGDFTGNLKLATAQLVSGGSVFPQLSVTNTSAANRASFDVTNDIGTQFGGEVFGSAFGGGFSNGVFIYAASGSTPAPFLRFVSSGEVASGGTTPIQFCAGGFSVLPQLSILPTGALQIGGTDLSLFRNSAGVIGIGDGTVTNFGSILAANYGALANGLFRWTNVANTVYDTGISRLGAASLAIGNSTAGNTTGNLSFNRVSLAGADFAGQATITAAATTVAVTFAANYTGTRQPVIVLTPTSDPLALGVPVGYWVTYSGSAGAWTGFTVNIQAALAGNVTFNYLVVGQA